MIDHEIKVIKKFVFIKKAPKGAFFMKTNIFLRWSSGANCATNSR